MATSGNLVTYGTAGNDVLHGGDFAQLRGGAGNDVYNLWSSTATVIELSGEGIDTVNARYWGPATLPSNIENLVLFTMGSTKGTGNALNNTITASPYGSTLNGMAGNDTLIGGAGADVFEFAKSSGSDKIVNFQLGWDSIRLQNFNYTSFQKVMAQGRQIGADAQFNFGGTKLTLQGVKLSDLTAADFGFALPDPAVPEGYLEMDGAGRAFNSNGWYVHNNAWGSSTLTEGKDYTVEAVYSRQDMTSGTTFTWTYPYTTEAFPQILAYPEVSFGVSPKAPEGHKINPTDTAAVFPVAFADIVSLVVDYHVSFGGTVSGFNVAYDIWLTSEPYGDHNTITHEIMFWVHTGDFPPFGKVVGTYSQDDFSATIYHEGTYIAIVTDKDVPKGQLDIVSVLNTLKDLGIVEGDEYLASIHLGAEIVSGNGTLTINNLDFTLETLEDDGSIVRKEVTGAGTSVTTIPPEVPVAEPEVVEISPAIIVEERDVFAGAKVASQVTTVDGATTETKFYGNDGNFLGVERIVAKGGGETMTLFFDASWKLLHALQEFTYPDGRVSTRYFDANWQFTGATDVSNNANGSLLTQHFDSNWQFTGAEDMSTKNGATTTNHYDADWKFTGADIVTVRADGSISIQHFDANWKFAGAEISQLGTYGVNLTTFYDADWAIVSRTHEGTADVDGIAASWGTNTILGGLGSDFLVGGNGADTFVFDTAIGNGDVDKIDKFQTGIDKIALDLDVFQALGSLGTLDPAKFVVSTAAKDADDRIIFDNASGNLYYDADGSGAGGAILFATLQGGVALSVSDFMIV